jgi:hypothetical protein
MALDSTAREANLKDSLKKFFVDNLHPTYALTFDKGLSTPRLQGQPTPVEKWVSVNFGHLDMGVMSDFDLIIYVCTRQDAEGFKLAQLRDTVVGLLSDTTQTDGMKRIPFYKSYAQQAWELIGALLVVDVTDSPQYEADDETKYKMLTVNLRWSAKI